MNISNHTSVSGTEIWKFLRMICWMTFLMGLTFTISEKVNTYQIKKGVAISRFIANNQNIDVPPGQAQYLNINLNQYDIQFSDFQIFPK